MILKFIRKNEIWTMEVYYTKVLPISNKIEFLQKYLITPQSEQISDWTTIKLNGENIK